MFFFKQKKIFVDAIFFRVFSTRVKVKIERCKVKVLELPFVVFGLVFCSVSECVFHMSRENSSVQDTSSKTPVSHGRVL